MIIIICILLAAGIIFWLIMSRKSDIGDYQTARVIRGDIENTVTSVGVLQPFYYVDVGAQVTGQLKTLKVKEAQFLFARQQHVRNSNLIKEDAVAVKDFETTEASLKTSQAEIEAINAQIKQSEAALKLAKANLDYTKITAPMSGVVVAVVASEGQILNANQQTLVIPGSIPNFL